MIEQAIPFALFALALHSTAPDQDHHATANAALELRRSDALRIEASGQPGGDVRARFELDGQVVELALAPFSVLQDTFELLVQRPAGDFSGVDVGPSRTLRGTVVGAPGSLVAGARLDTGFRLCIRHADGKTLWIEPMAPHAAGADPRDHVAYRPEDVLTPPDARGALAAPPVATPSVATGGTAGSVGPVLHLAEIAFDTDVQMYTAFGSDPASVRDSCHQRRRRDEHPMGERSGHPPSRQQDRRPHDRGPAVQQHRRRRPDRSVPDRVAVELRGRSARPRAAHHREGPRWLRPRHRLRSLRLRPHGVWPSATHRHELRPRHERLVLRPRRQLEREPLPPSVPLHHEPRAQRVEHLSTPLPDPHHGLPRHPHLPRPRGVRPRRELLRGGDALGRWRGPDGIQRLAVRR